jgi:hypothetical protein
MNVCVNPFVKALMRSPLHGLIEKRTLLISGTGWRTGRPFTTPVNYVANGEVLTILTSRNKTWWRNFGNARPRARILLRGKWRFGSVRVLTLSPEETSGAYGDYMERLTGKRPDSDQLKKAALERLILRVELEPIEGPTNTPSPSSLATS